MRIKKLVATNLGPYAALEFTPTQRVVLVYGENGAGKTSLAEILEYALDGKARGGPAALLKQGTLEGTVQLTLTGQVGEVVTARKVGPSGTGHVGLPDVPVAWALCHAEALLDADPAKQKQFLLQAAQPTISVAEVRKHIDLSIVPREVLSLPTDAIDPALNKADVDAIFKWAFLERTLVRRQVNALRVVEAVTWPADGRPDVEDIEQQLEALRAELRGMRQSPEAQTATRQKELTDQLQQAITRQQDVRKRRATEDESRAAAGGRIATTMFKPFTYATAEEYRNEINRLTHEFDGARSRHAAWTTETAQAKEGARIEQEERLAAVTAYTRLRKLGGSCVLHVDIPCPLKGDGKRDALLQLSKRIEELPERPPGWAPVLPAEPTSPEWIEKQLRELGMELTRLETQLEAEAATDQAVQVLLDQGARMSDVLATPAPQVQGDLLTEGVAEDPVEALEQRIRAGEGVKRQAEAMIQQEARHAAYVTEQAGLEARWKALDTAVKYLGPKGALDEALGQAFAPIQAMANQFLAVWGWELTVELEPFALGLADGRPLVRLSDSEKWRVATAIALAAAVTSGWKTVVLDRADTLSGDNRGLLVDVIGLAADLDLTVIVLTTGAPPVPGELPPDVECWVVTAGEKGSTLTRA